MSLNVGYYKISQGQGANKTYHLLRVWKNKSGQLAMRIDNDVDKELTDLNAHFWNDFEQTYTVEKQYTIHRPLEVKLPRITVTFKDEDGHPYTMTVRSLKRFNELLEMFPRLKKEL